MGTFSSQSVYHNVYETPIIGRLDRTSEDRAFSDATLIRKYIRVEKNVKASAPDCPIPSISREVLLKIWESPRIKFHHEARKSFTKEFRNKLLWIPWSIEAAERWNQTHSINGLVLEHVTPIDAMWRKLTKLDDEFEDPNSDLYSDPEREDQPHHIWEDHAVNYLIKFWSVAVLTVEQSRAIDSYKGLRAKGFEPNPFERYLRAEELMDKDRAEGKARPSFSTAKFIISGHKNDMA